MFLETLTIELGDVAAKCTAASMMLQTFETFKPYMHLLVEV